MTPLFDVILIETKNTCTRSCWFCKFGQERKDEAILQMDWHTVKRIIHNLKDLHYAGRISWFWINEPLMEERILEILKLTRKHCRQAFLSLITNGDLLNESLYDDLRKCGLDALGVSIYDDLAYDKIAGMKKDDRLVMLDMRKPPPGRLDNRAGNIRRNPKAFRDYQRQFLNKSCERPFSMMTINPKGHVVLCCADMYSDVVMGDVNKEKLEEIWSSDSFNHYRKTLRQEGRRNLKLCDNCSYEGSASLLFYPLRRKTRQDYLAKARSTYPRIFAGLHAIGWSRDKWDST